MSIRYKDNSYSRMIDDVRVKKYLPIFNNNYAMTNYIKNLLKSGRTDTEVMNIYKLIAKTFIANGKTKEEAVEYMCKNRLLFQLGDRKLFTILAILNKGGFAEEALLNNPNFLLRIDSIARLDYIVNIALEKFECPSIETVKLYYILSRGNKNMEDCYTYTKEEGKTLVLDYRNKLNKSL